MKVSAPGPLRQSQHGGSFLATMIIVALIALFLLAGLKVTPAYIDNKTIMDTVESVIANNDMRNTSISEVRTQTMRTLNVNNIDFESGSIQYVTEGDVEYIDVNYERRTHLFYNIDAVMTFENRVERLP